MPWNKELYLWQTISGMSKMVNNCSDYEPIFYDFSFSPSETLFILTQWKQWMNGWRLPQTKVCFLVWLCKLKSFTNNLLTLKVALLSVPYCRKRSAQILYTMLKHQLVKASAQDWVLLKLIFVSLTEKYRYMYMHATWGIEQNTCQ